MGTASLPQIDHIVVLMMENHSFDNHFGMLRRKGVDGFTIGRDGKPTNSNPGPDGQPVYAYHAPSTCQAHYKVSQSWNVSHRSWDHGRNDGFVKASSADAMAYWDETDLPFYYGLASVFPVCDRYFSSVMAQTYPNRRFLLAASAFGLVGDPLPESLLTSSPRPWGFGTIFEALDAYGISWKNYFSDLPTTALFPYLLQSNADRVTHVTEFFTDAAAGTLPGFSLVDPNFGSGSEENPQDLAVGAYFAYQVIDAVMKSPAWHRTVLVLTFDEHGGYYDHVPPPPAVRPDDIPPEVPSDDTYGDLYSWYGFRVPTVVVSAWARPHYVSHVVHDHTSILRLVETKWNLPALSDRDANASNLVDCLALDAPTPPFGKPPKLSPALPAVDAAACMAAAK